MPDMPEEGYALDYLEIARLRTRLQEVAADRDSWFKTARDWQDRALDAEKERDRLRTRLQEVATERDEWRKNYEVANNNMIDLNERLQARLANDDIDRAADAVYRLTVDQRDRAWLRVDFLEARLREEEKERNAILDSGITVSASLDRERARAKKAEARVDFLEAALARAVAAGTRAEVERNTAEARVAKAEAEAAVLRGDLADWDGALSELDPPLEANPSQVVAHIAELRARVKHLEETWVPG